MKKSIAIIGGGIAGLTAGYLLNGKYDIALYEKNDYIGGNAYTYQTKSGETIEIAAASVMAPAAKNFITLCKHAGVPTIKRYGLPLSIHDTDSQQGIYPSFGLKSLLAQKFRIFKPLSSVAKASYAILRAVNLLDSNRLKDKTVAEMFDLLPELDGYSRMFIMGTLCMLSLMHYDDVLKAPAQFFVNKLKMHKVTNPLISLTNNTFPKHFTRSYVNAFASPFKDAITMHTPVKSVERNKEHIVIKLTDGTRQTFDNVIFACGADQALSLLEKPSKEEERLLGPWRYAAVETVIHKDPTYAPKRELCQPWTLVCTTRNGSPHFSHYFCSWNLSPATPKNCDYYATHHPAFPINERLIDCVKSFRVPIFDCSSYATQKELPSLNGNLNSYYCGSYFGIGLHGAAVDSAIDVARRLGVVLE